MADKIVGIGPYQYVHILDVNTNITSLKVGPQNLVLSENQKLIKTAAPFVKIPPGSYCVVVHPLDGRKAIEEGKPYPLRFGYREVRLTDVSPFPLFPGEELEGKVSAIKKLPVIQENQAIHLLASMEYEDEEGVVRQPGEQWQIKGPRTYIPVPEVEIVGITRPSIIGPNEALRIKAKADFTDGDGEEHYLGQEWLVRTEGSYLPGVYEQVVRTERALTLTLNKALHIRAEDSYTDQFGKKRKIGDEWLVTCKDTTSYIPDVTEDIIEHVDLIVLKPQQYGVVSCPVGKNGKPQLGVKELRKGPMTFFLHPGENMEAGIQPAYILSADEAIVLTAVEEFDDIVAKKKIHRLPGEKWMIVGPLDYIPPVEVQVEETRKAIPLNKNEGVYVRDLNTGQVRCEMGPQAYLLKANEELYKKDLTPLVEEILKNGGGLGSEDVRKIAYFDNSVDVSFKKGRDKTRVVAYRCPSNCAVQVYNYREKTARVIFGPDLVVLGPHENFNVLSLSAGKPKKENALKTICLMLGPDYISDIIEVETSDHARLKVSYAMNNFFRFTPDDDKSAAALFNVPDFIGFACREVASRVRGMVARIPFEEFHRHSSEIIRQAVFGKDEKGEVKPILVFSANNLVISGIDVHTIEPKDLHMKDSLAKSVQMAIEISTKSIERSAAHEAARMEQEAKGLLERQKLLNEKSAEEERNNLLEIQSITAAVESTGQAKAEAQAQAERLIIEGQSAIEIAQLKAEANRIELECELESQEKMQKGELEFLRQMNELEIEKARELGQVEVSKLASQVEAIGSNTIKTVALSGPESQGQMLAALGIQSVLLTDGKSPLHLYHGSSGSYVRP
jgi:major vault protein